MNAINRLDYKNESSRREILQGNVCRTRSCSE
jgi:hypothetical protein